jgi:hypothetical protein
LEDQEEIKRFLDIYHPKLNLEDINHLTRSLTSNEIDVAIKNSPKKKSTGPDRLTA